MALARTAVAGGVGVEHPRCGCGDRIRRGVQRGRVEVALQRDAATGAAHRLVQVQRPVQAQCIGAGLRQRFQVQAGTLAEQDQRRALAAFAALQALGDALQVAQRELAVHGRRQHAAPGVEHLQRLRTGRALRAQVRNHRVGGDLQQAVQGLRMVQRHCLDAREILAAAAFHHVAGQCPGAAGEADQRYLAVQLPTDQAHRVHHVAKVLFHVRHRQPGDGGFITHRVAELRAFAFDEVQLQAHRIGNGEDVREQDGCVQRESAQRLQRDFAGDLRVLGHGQEAAGLGPGCAVLRQVAAGLAHQPDGGAVHRFAAQGAQQAIVAEGAGHDGHSLDESWQRRQSPCERIWKPRCSSASRAFSKA